MFGINTKEPPSLMSIYRYFYNSGENKYEFGFKVRDCDDVDGGRS